jgi:N-acetylmuramoyl-L-alanine amidase
MRLRARLLHILAIAPVAATLAAVLGATAHAQTSAGGEPQPVVIALDPGHGGAPDPSHPSQPFDPGAIAAGGLMEKVVTLDVAERVATLLHEDLVQTVLTRDTDEWVTISDREQIGIDAHAQRFISIHCNSFTDTTASGSLVLYPGATSLAFAQTIADTLGRDLATSGVPGQGTVLRDDWWIHNPMPTATVEIAYLSNPREAALLASTDFRQQAAMSIRDGIERGDPDIATRKVEIQAWLAEHPGAPKPVLNRSHAAAHPVVSHATGGFTPLAVVPALIALSIVGAVYWREGLSRLVGLHRAAARRRRRRLRLDALAAMPERRFLQRSVYDDLPL